MRAIAFQLTIVIVSIPMSVAFSQQLPLGPYALGDLAGRHIFVTH